MPDDQQWNSTQRMLWHFDSNVDENMIDNTIFFVPPNLVGLKIVGFRG